MNKTWTRLVIWLAMLLPFAVLAQIPERPDPPRLVNDFAGILEPSQVNQLEDSLVLFAQETSTQIVVVTVKSLNGYDKADFAYRLGENWGVGQKGKNNGIVVLVKPKYGNEPGQVFIATGYGLEGVIPDAVANGKIIDREMIPRFRENDYFGGIRNGTRVIMSLARGEYTAEQYQGGAIDSGFPAGAFIILFFILLILIISLTKGGKNNRTYNTGSRSLPLWILLGMMNAKGRSGGSWSDFSGGRGGFGGFGGGGGGGGGFGGFGGGSFGGGGAGGSW